MLHCGCCIASGHMHTHLVIDLPLITGLVERAWTGLACDQHTLVVLAAVKAGDLAEVNVCGQRGQVLQGSVRQAGLQ